MHITSNPFKSEQLEKKSIPNLATGTELNDTPRTRTAGMDMTTQEETVAEWIMNKKDKGKLDKEYFEKGWYRKTMRRKWKIM